MIGSIFRRGAPPAVLAGRAGGAREPEARPAQQALQPVTTAPPIDSGGLSIDDILGGSFRPARMPAPLHDEHGAFALLEDARGVLVALRRQDMASTATGYWFVTELRKALPKAKLLDVPAAKMREVEALGQQAAHSSRAQTISTTQQHGYELAEDAMKLDASDVHIDIEAIGPRSPSVLLRARVDGELTTLQHFNDAQTVRVYEEVVRAYFQNEAAGLSSERNTSVLSESAGRFYRRLQLPVRNAEIRFESDKTSTGSKTVLRLLNYDGKPSLSTDLVGLGFAASQADVMLSAFTAPDGLILSFGSTGAGKTQTIATALSMNPNAAKQCRLGMEQPPEISIPYMQQLMFEEDEFEDALRGALRLDPDVIYCGEINSKKVAELSIQAAMTGHLVPATMHANNVFTGIRRLVGDRGMQIPREDLCADDMLRAAQFQTLVPKLCPECREQALPHLSRQQIEAFEILGVDPLNLYVRHQRPHNNCKVCGGRGIKGRTLLAEVVRPTADWRDALLTQGVGAAMEVHRAMRQASFVDEDQTGKDAAEHGLYKAARGMICTKQLVRLYDPTTHREVLKTLKRRLLERGSRAQRPEAEEVGS